MAIDYEAILPLELVRVHTKTDDVPHVTDGLLALYREAAFDAAEKYAGLKVSTDGYTTQEVEKSSGNDMIVRLKFPAVDGIIQVIDGSNSKTIVATPGASKIVLRASHHDFHDGDIIKTLSSNCCETCVEVAPSSVMLKYKSANCGAPKVSAEMKQAILQYIAWAIENPGDQVKGSYEASVGASTVPAMAIKTFKRLSATIGF
ncbi:MAG: hypothetical protein ACRCYS_17060 [Beijerinckiaceae bacterium]